MPIHSFIPQKPANLFLEGRTPAILGRLASAAAMAAVVAAANVAPVRQAEAQTQPVVIELFTSQGCSSCPPADRFLQELAVAGRHVLPLSLHVDYWDRLGWKDEFASPAISSRQREYARKGGRDIVYTPQMIMHGQAHVVGSDRKKVNRLIADLSSRRAEAPFDAVSLVPRASLGALSGAQGGRGHCWALLPDGMAEGDVGGTFSPRTLDVTVITYRTDLAETDVKAGENRGRTLSYANVVTGLEESSADSWPVFVSTALRLKKGEAGVILLQNARTGAILSVVTPETGFFAAC